MNGLASWTNFFGAEVGATAALAGLVAVAISINLARILEFRSLVGRAAETLVMLVGVLVVSSIALIPEPERFVGLEIAIVALIVWAWPTVVQIASFFGSSRETPRRPLIRFFLTQISTAPALTGGVLVALGAEQGFYWIAAGVLITLAAGVLNTWVLLVEILR